ncbi:recombinase family protein [Streptomyces sp. NBC_01262]|uniref:recombinase family protein n=1 Tax=Streptomyces sp. NBC_01262 TaxID=2903803 RepID=UPI002E37E390|nr:recombinase family protein [Streptomyces sp. NBC_01262]
MRLSTESFGAQMELRAIQKRNRDETTRARQAGQPKQMNAYGYRFVRLFPTAKADHVEIDPVAAGIIRRVAERILTDETGTITAYTEATRLTRAAVPSPRDHRAIMYGREPKGTPWTGPAIRNILTSESSLGYLMHQGRPVIGKDGHPVSLAPQLWDRATRDQLITVTAPRKASKRPRTRAPKGTRLLSGHSADCGSCARPLKILGNSNSSRYGCNGRVLGVLASQDCKPAPSMQISILDAFVTDWFLARYGTGQVFRREYDPGTGYAARIKELEADRKRLRDDRAAGLYEAEDDTAWYCTEYARMGREIAELRELPERPAAMRMMPTGQTIADRWHAAKDDAERREMLNEYAVKITLYPKGAAERITISAAVSLLPTTTQAQADTQAA